MNPTDLDLDTSVYDYETHTPYPTQSYILEKTGENLAVSLGDSKLAKATIRQLTDSFKNIVNAENIRDTSSTIEFLVASKKEWRNEWIRCTSSFIYACFNTVRTEEERKIKALEIIEGSHLLSIKRFTRVDYTYRSGY